MPWQPKWSTAGAPASPAILHPGLPLSGRTGAVLTPLKAHCSPVRPLFQVLSGAVPPLPPRYSPELRLLVGSILQQNPAPRPTIDDILQTTAVGWAWNIRSYVLSRAEDWLHGTLLSRSTALLRSDHPPPAHKPCLLACPLPLAALQARQHLALLLPG